MAGLQMLRVEFAGPSPSWPEVIAKAEEIGGMALMFERLPDDGASAAFAGAPDAGMRRGLHREWGNIFFTVWPGLGTVRVSQGEDPRAIGVTDYSHASPTLVALLQHALVALGGTARGDGLLPLDAPLTPEKLRREQRETQRLAARAAATVLGLLVALAAFVVLLAWAAWTGARALLAG